MLPLLAPRPSWLARLQSIHVAVWMALGGGTYMLGNLVLAGSLVSEDFGRLVLFQAILGLGVSLAPLGLDSLVVRRELRFGNRALRAAVVTGLITAAISGTVAVVLFGFTLTALALMAPAVLIAATARMYAAAEQADLRLGRAQFLAQLPSLCFGAGAIALSALKVTAWYGGAAALASGYVVSAIFGLAMTRGRGSAQRATGEASAPDREAWNKALAFVGILASVLVLHQIERLIIPWRLGLEALATFAVIATVVGSPYRVLHGAIAYALMPRMRAEQNVEGRRRLVRTELLLALWLGVGGGIVLVTLARPLIQLLYGDKYGVQLSVVIAIAAVGGVRLFYAVAAATVTALGGQRELGRFNALGWLSTAVATAGTIVFSLYGILGAVVGAGLGWLVRLAAAAVLAQPALRHGRPPRPDELRTPSVRTD